MAAFTLGGMQATLFGALAEPSRLRIVELLRTGPLSVGEIAEALDIRQPQVSKHLRVLDDSGLVSGAAQARRRIYRLEPEPFEEIARWAGSFERLWEARLDSLGAYLDSITDGRDEN
ncbi:transcriptional regulator [Mycolicibacterium chitae]|uniref:Regulatory protein ArsR n=2 Tax=Mycobacteriaceae TaxID=1762 RepID=A0A3S4RHU6_MYCCI|nr:transcriptional regulator [Mycolicibacterium chitae]VEG44095.1 regulatory protein ArsR [Mycolicibacterium chitae]